MRRTPRRQSFPTSSTVRSALSNEAGYGLGIADVILPERFSAVMMSAMAALGLTLAALGLYGVMAFSVRQRTREIGLRMALGARSRDVLAQVMREGVVLTVTGLAIGIAGAVASTRLLSTMLYDVSPRDPVTFPLVSAVLVGVALAACYGPARRATSVAPTLALRYE